MLQKSHKLKNTLPVFFKRLCIQGHYRRYINVVLSFFYLINKILLELVKESRFFTQCV